MNHFSLAHVPDPILLVDLDNDHDREGIDTAWRLARIAETEARRLYLPAGYASMRDYCVGHLRLPREDAYKRVRVARAARKFPLILHGIAERKYHVSTLVILVPFLTRENADELLASAANQSRAGIERLVADRFPRPDFPAHFQVADPPTELILSEKMETSPNSLRENREVSISQGSVSAADGRERPPEGTAVPPMPRPQIQPHSPGRVEWHLTVEQETQDLLRRAQGADESSAPFA